MYICLSRGRCPATSLHSTVRFNSKESVLYTRVVLYEGMNIKTGLLF
jgi:hypothetical protein